ncbi:substrate-binding periplasmic protein [Sedimenticola selenatireducens]|uniref:Transporter substrate-binding domain-containing protein n=1 Tax=Sedimenticola selenatireducens TaxID=191960 RepID=A0A558DXD4_9GAMM|nr:transporter substrate-binding domain-containing protein [Sedimenticola selenatireducens]TVO70750.1 transporter substrate-binding domain-containing protein [Sedimenticola selenatireducens]TVT65670.1 MAG: transporter substrate-binding domain-containing protein [Sedimenticola selenatireducens]
MTSRVYNNTLYGMTLISLLIFPAISWADDSTPEIEYAYPNQSVWTIRTDDKGILKNPLLDFAATLFSQANMKWHSAPYPAKRLFSNLKNGISNFAILVRANSLKECCIFSQAPVTRTELRVYRLNNAAPIQSMDDLKGKRVITILGYSYGTLGRFIRNKENKIERFNAPNHQSAFAMLAHKRAEYLLDYTGPSAEVLADNPIEGVQDHILSQLDVYLVLNKNYPDVQRVMDRLETIARDIPLDIPRR